MTGPGFRAAVALALLLPGSASAAAPGPQTPIGVRVASAALTENASAWDGQSVTYGGEAVGEAMVRGDHAWLHVNDDAYQARDPGEDRPLAGYNSGQAVWAPAGLARRVRRFGGYGREGDAVLVRGEFHAACGEHGGDMDIHATSLEIVREGRAHPQRLNLGRLGVGLGLLALAAALLLALRRTRYRRG